ncbi:hypothetical protein [Hamadaea tsunoensis]|uniref:hypothetical protein n=1 Tax=Hamadaea tsunoensis TaxID=53368 RepID=UPI0012F99A32|nr:hypothetical protein [Hamadaea tsunoensis]
MDGWVIIGSVGIIAWAVVMVGWAVTGRTRKEDAGQLRAALEASTAANQQLADKLAAVDQRLAAVERTLTDIG